MRKQAIYQGEVEESNPDPYRPSKSVECDEATSAAQVIGGAWLVEHILEGVDEVIVRVRREGEPRTRRFRVILANRAAILASQDCEYAPAIGAKEIFDA